VIGAHYDTHKDSPGANDNGSAIAALLELAARASDQHPQRTLRFVAFTNEETPFTRTREMGSQYKLVPVGRLAIRSWVCCASKR